MTAENLLQTPLFSRHVQAKAFMAGFGGWHMPIYFTSVIEEHLAVRADAGLFDLCHMGLVEFQGSGAAALIQKLITNNINKISDRQALYSPMCNENGGTIDDLIVYRLSSDRFLIIENASNHQKDLAWFSHQAKGTDCRISDLSSSHGLIGVQGPATFDVLGAVLGKDFSGMKYFSIVQSEYQGDGLYVCRTGYTGEKGVEIIAPRKTLAPLWESLHTARPGKSVPFIGLGARDSLRLEMGYSLYGHELEEDISPLEAGLGWTVDLSKESFTGKAALLSQSAHPPRRLWGLLIEDRSIARAGAQVLSAGRAVGRVTSGGYSPSLKKNIALALVENDGLTNNDRVEVVLRPGRTVPAVLTGRVFYRPQVK